MSAGNGAREALREILDEFPIWPPAQTSDLTDLVLTKLWILGFQIVPLDDVTSSPLH